MKSHQETILDVQGMSCGSCVRHIDQALHRLQGIRHVEVRLAERKVRVHHDAERASVPQLIEALAEAGYDAIRSTA